MARPKNQQARRREIVRAARDAIAERGLTGLRTVDVAARTTLGPRAVAYYYPDLEDLVQEVHREAVSRFYWNRLQEIEREADPRAKLRVLIRSGIPRSRDDADVQALNELHTHAYRDAFHARLMAELFAKEVSLYTAVLEEGVACGAFALRLPVSAAASNLVALEDAYGLHYLGGTPLEADEIFGLIAGLADLLVGGALGEEPPPVA